MTSPRKQPRRIPLTLTGRGVFVLASAVLLCACWRLLGLHGLSIFSFFLAACLLLAVLTVVAGPRVAPPVQGKRILRAESTTATVGEPLTIHASFETRRHPAAALEAEWEISEYLTEPQRRSAPVNAQPQEGRGRHAVSAMLTTEFRSRGPATLCLLAVQFQDPLGLVRRRIKTDERVEVLVLPRLLTGERRPGASEALGAGDTQQRTTALEQRGLPGGDVREYQAGDPVRQIHWKQSARQRELLIRLPEQEPQFAVDLRLNTDPASYPTADSFEYAVSVAATDGLRRLRAGNPVRLLAGSADPELCTTTSQLMRALAFVRLDEPTAVTHD